MSQQIAVNFIRKVQTDDALRTEVTALGQDMDGLVALAAQHGYTFTVENLQAAFKQLGPTVSEQELTDTQMEAVVGGFNADFDGMPPAVDVIEGPSMRPSHTSPPPWWFVNLFGLPD